jgi:hypothetical protein
VSAHVVVTIMGEDFGSQVSLVWFSHLNHVLHHRNKEPVKQNMFHIILQKPNQYN